MKHCYCCGISKPLSDFHKYKRSKDGHQKKCKSCCSAYAKTHYKKNAQKYKDNHAKRFAKMPEYYRKHSAAKRALDPDKENERVAKSKAKAKLKATACVYLIKNNVTDKIYVGQTTWKHQRWTQHRNELVCGKHYVTSMQEDCNNYGIDSFDFIVHKEVVSKKRADLLKEEADAIKFFLSQGTELYNIQKPA